MSYKSNCIKEAFIIDVSASICNIIYLHISPAINCIQIICQSYKLTIMLLVTAISILKGPNTLTVQLEYINLFNLNHIGHLKQILERNCLSLASHYLIFRPN